MSPTTERYFFCFIGRWPKLSCCLAACTQVYVLTAETKFVASAARTQLSDAEKWMAFVMKRKAVVQAHEARADGPFLACVLCGPCMLTGCGRRPLTAPTTGG
jgi:hypothetical protein